MCWHRLPPEAPVGKCRRAGIAECCEKRCAGLRNRVSQSAEESIHFYAVAINSRTTQASRPCCVSVIFFCGRSMQELLKPLAKATPPVLTYIDKGVGASILKAGWVMGWQCEQRGIKVTSTISTGQRAIMHETGHQMAHILNWNEELSAALNNELTNHAPMVRGSLFEVVERNGGGCIAFVHTGFAAVAALHDVVSGMPHAYLPITSNDPHLYLLRQGAHMNIEMCRQFYGAGPWDDLEKAFTVYARH